jgi:DNA gyrase subunit A
VISIIRSSKSIPEAKASLMERFGFDDVQATAIVQMRLGALTGLERDKLEEELAGLQAQISEWEELLASPEKLLALLKDELERIKDKFNDPRRTEIVNISGEVDVEDLIPVEDCVYTMTNMGYVKRVPIDTYQSQKRGGKGIKGMTRREEDVVQTMFTCSTHDYVMAFTTKGRVYRLKGYEIPEGSRSARGMNIVNILPVASEESVSALIQVSKAEAEAERGEHYLCMVTRKGVIKRIALSEFRNVRKNGVIALGLAERGTGAYQGQIQRPAPHRDHEHLRRGGCRGPDPRGGLRLHHDQHGLRQAAAHRDLPEPAARRQGHQGHDAPRGRCRTDHVHLLHA